MHATVRNWLAVRSVTAASHASAACSAAASTTILSCRAHHSCTVFRRSQPLREALTTQASHAMAQSQLTSEGATSATEHCRVAVTRSHAHRCLPRFSRMLSCCQHDQVELHTTAAPSLRALSLREALTSVAWLNRTDQRRCCMPLS
jgi:hypothetical protein